MTQERILNKEDLFEHTDYVLIAINEEQVNEIKDFLNNNNIRETPDTILSSFGISFNKMLLFGESFNPDLKNNDLKEYTSKVFENMRWFNVDDIFTQNIMEHQKADNHLGYIPYMTQGIRTPLELFKEHLKRLDNPQYSLIYKRKRLNVPKRLSNSPIL